MTTIVHLSDLHFGTEAHGVIDWIVADIHVIKPDVIIISGDFTQRALHRQYKAAQHFLEQIQDYPLLCVPGNHDISLHNWLERFFYPFAKYKKYITDDLMPSYCDNEVAILGLTTATPYKAKSGTLSDQQLTAACDFFENHKDKIKIVVMHHNLIHSEKHKAIGRTEAIIQSFASCHVNLILSGHLHYACVELLKRSSFKHNMYVVTAGTAVSKRLRKGQNSYNVLQIFPATFKLEIRELTKSQFVVSEDLVFSL